MENYKTWGRSDGFANILKFVIFLNGGILLLQILTKKRTVQRYCNRQEMRGFLKKFTEGNTRNSWLINYADVTKISKTRMVWGRMSKICVRAITPTGA